ncbi:MAG: hypothetical protein IPM76_02175 [Chloroflexi bacterium]|nr:hypothetical protein [Chloroflexota bacterium]
MLDEEQTDPSPQDGELNSPPPVEESLVEPEIVLGTAVTVSPIDSETPSPVTKSRPPLPPEPEEELDMTQPSTPDTPAATPTRPPAPTSTPPAAPATSSVSQRRGCVFLLLGAVLGAFFGMVFSLAVLMGLNGTLTFSQADAQLRRDINEAAIRQANLEDTLATRDSQVNGLATRLADLSGQQDEMSLSLQNADQELATVEGQVTAVYANISTLDNRLEQAEIQLTAVASAAESFNSFLGGLRDLLQEVQPPTITPTADGGAAGKATPTAASGSGTVAPTQTPASQPTRTPRPTRTPLALPSSTAVPANIPAPTHTAVPTEAPTVTPQP